MEQKDKILDVQNLRISFWTNNGTVKAVRGISFSLYRGRTLAIVGESGSGKSVTARAIMGILAPNRIVEEGEILYDGHDILRLSEEELCKIRGSKIAMIFQDPMSSLNPIMKVGNQITEAMMLKKKASIREARISRNYVFGRLFNQDPSIKNDLIAMKKGLPYHEEKIIAASSLLRDRNHETITKNIRDAEALLKNIRASEAFDGKDKDFFLLRKKLSGIRTALATCENHLTAYKDERVYTFYVTVKYYLSEYKRALKRERIATKKKAKEQRFLAKGKIRSASFEINQRAWSSEIDTSHEAIFKKTCDYFDSFISYLDSLSTDGNSHDFAAEGMSLFSHLKEYIALSNQKTTKSEFKAQAIKVLDEVGIAEPEKRINQYPFQFSGGMRQRIVIAIALSSNPEVLICDEPTTALDVTIQAQILDLINKLKKERNLSVIFITHNLGVVADMADDIAVMYAGKIVEYGTTEDIFYDPRHPYTWALLSSIPGLDTKDRLDAIPGTPPNMIIPPKGDAFAARNKYALSIDFKKEPPFFKISDTHYAATWLLDPRCPKIDMPVSIKNRIKHFNLMSEKLAEKNSVENKEALISSGGKAEK